MRNGNIMVCGMVYHGPMVLILPMRNGNKLLLYVFLSFLHFRSYPTYEEWKQIVSRFCTFLSDFGSYPTYEEWKPIWSYFPTIGFFVLILPMRNGNLALYSEFGTIITVLILPMRNGNDFYEKVLEYLDIKVLILPMRNGNRLTQR